MIDTAESTENLLFGMYDKYFVWFNGLLLPMLMYHEFSIFGVSISDAIFSKGSKKRNALA